MCKNETRYFIFKRKLYFWNNAEMSQKTKVRSQHIIIRSCWHDTILVMRSLSRDLSAHGFKQHHSMVVPSSENHMIDKKCSEFWSDNNFLSKTQKTNILHRKRDWSSHSHHSPQGHSWNHSHIPGHQSHQGHSQGHHSSCRDSSSLCLRFGTWCDVEGEVLENGGDLLLQGFIVFQCRCVKPQQSAPSFKICL